MINMISQLLSRTVTDAITNKTEHDLKAGRGKKLVAVPRFMRIFMYVVTPFILGLASLGFILPADAFPTLAGRIIVTGFLSTLFLIAAAYVVLSGTRIVYNDSEIEVTTFWIRKSHYNILDIRKARSSLYFYTVTFTDSFVILIDSMTASSEFYGFAKKHAAVVKGKY